MSTPLLLDIANNNTSALTQAKIETDTEKNHPTLSFFSPFILVKDPIEDEDRPALDLDMPRGKHKSTYYFTASGDLAGINILMSSAKASDWLFLPIDMSEPLAPKNVSKAEQCRMSCRSSILLVGDHVSEKRLYEQAGSKKSYTTRLQALLSDQQAVIINVSEESLEDLQLVRVHPDQPVTTYLTLDRKESPQSIWIDLGILDLDELLGDLK